MKYLTWAKIVPVLVFSLFVSLILVVIVYEVIAGALASGSTDLLEKVLDGKVPTLEDFGRSLAVGAVGGLLGAAIGQAGLATSGRGAVKTLGEAVGTKCRAFVKILKQAALQGGGNAAGNALTTFFGNIITQGKIKR